MSVSHYRVEEVEISSGSGETRRDTSDLKSDTLETLRVRIPFPRPLVGTTLMLVSLP